VPDPRRETVGGFGAVALGAIARWTGRYDLPRGVVHSNKPVIVITARTHPGEPNASFAMEGFINQLLREGACKTCCIASAS
jgi:hypothetical protein